MRLWSVLLRALLALALVLNGTGAAMAAVEMDASAMAVLKAPAPASRAGHACHGMDMVAAKAAVPEQRIPKAQDPRHPAPDCCKSASCTCACMHGVEATTLLINQSEAPNGARLPVSLAAGHTEPALRHLIRPPID